MTKRTESESKQRIRRGREGLGIVLAPVCERESQLFPLSHFLHIRADELNHQLNKRPGLTISVPHFGDEKGVSHEKLYDYYRYHSASFFSFLYFIWGLQLLQFEDASCRQFKNKAQVIQSLEDV